MKHASLQLALAHLTALAIVIAASSGHAQETTAVQQAPEASAPTWGAGTSAGRTGLGLVGTVGGVFVGAGIGQVVAGPCYDGPPPMALAPAALLGPCDFHGLGESVVGAVLTPLLTTPLLVWGGGELLGHDGSFAATLLGSTLGVGVGALGFLIHPAVGFAGVLLVPSVGATISYYLSTDDGTVTKPRTGLVHYDPEEGAGLGVPSVGFLEHQGETYTTVSVLGGTF